MELLVSKKSFFLTKLLWGKVLSFHKGDFVLIDKHYLWGDVANDNDFAWTVWPCITIWPVLFPWRRQETAIWAANAAQTSQCILQQPPLGRPEMGTAASPDEERMRRTEAQHLHTHCPGESWASTADVSEQKAGMCIPQPSAAMSISKRKRLRVMPWESNSLLYPRMGQSLPLKCDPTTY